MKEEMTHRTPRELIEIYWDKVYNSGETELVREVCADPIIRHDAGTITPLSHDEQISRVERSLAMKPLFTHRVLHADDRFVTSVWNMEDRAGRGIKLCGIEVFEAKDGRFTRCWNSPYMKGFWGEDEDLFDPSALTEPALITAPGEITADWIQRALAAGGLVQPQLLAMEPEVEPVGHGTTSTIVTVRLVYNVGKITAPTTAICKIGKQPEGALSTTSPFERELRSYELFGNAPDFRVPQLYYGASDASGLCNILMEDLSATAQAGNQITGCSIAEAGSVVHELARFHLAFWADTNVVELDWLTKPKLLLPAYVMGSTVVREWLGDQISETAFQVIDGFAGLAESWLDHPPARQTLIHGDPRVDNILFEETNSGTRACLIDWQSLGSGDPQYDIAYFLSGSLSPEDRRTCERDLLAEYAALIAATDPGYTLDLAIEGYRRNIVSGLWLTIIAAAYVERSEHNAELLRVLIERNTAAVIDWDGLAAIG